MDRALFATSRRLTPRMRHKLEAEAGKLGVTLLQIYDQDWFASYLYGNAEWCNSLLDVTGRPHALSPFPVTQRPVLGDRVFGRDREMRWLQERSGDCLLVGAPGSGKTFLLRALVLQGQALFLVDDDRQQIANDLRSLKPPAVIIDDAHVDPGRIERFAQLRTEVGSGVQIIATSWPGHAGAVQRALQIPDSEVLELEQIDADTMIEVIKATGVSGPDDLLRIIRVQAAGRPGLAATLSHMCLAGDVRRAASGEGLVDQLGPQLDRMLDVQDATRILAPFALGGDAGVRLGRVADGLRRSHDEVGSHLAQLAAAGIVMERPRGAVSVEPPPMRWVLVRRGFFSGAGSLDIAPFLSIVEDQEDALHALIGARSRGASVPDLQGRLERAGSDRLWLEYASLGEAEARYVADRSPGRILEVSGQVLEHAPEAAIPLLLDRVGETGRLGSQDPLSEDPLDALAAWTTRLSPDREEWLYRRSVLVHAADRWRLGGGNTGTALRVMCIALNPKSEYTTSDPGRGRTVNLHFGALGRRQVRALADLWLPVLNVLRDPTDSDPPWRDLLSLVSAWVHYPFDQLLGISDEVRSEILTFTNRMLQDLANASRHHAGLQHSLWQAGKPAGLSVDVTLDPDFETLHEHLQPDAEIEMMRSGPPDNMVEAWERRSIEEMVQSLARIDSEENIAGIDYPRWSPRLCARLAERVSTPVAVAKRFMDAGLPADLVEPFIDQGAKKGHPRWPALVRRCLGDDHYRGLAVHVAVTHEDPPQDLLSLALQAAGDFPRHVDTWCLRDEIPAATLQQMLCSADARVAVAAAIGHWCAGEIQLGTTDATNRVACPSCGNEVHVEAVLCRMCSFILKEERFRELPFADGAREAQEARRKRYECWRRAILRAPADGATVSDHDDYWLGRILSKNRRLAEDWLVSKFAPHDHGARMWTIERIAVKVTAALSSAQRATVLSALTSRCRADKLVASLVDDDAELYRQLLETRGLSELHLAPLAGKPGDAWRRKALLALGKGYSVDEIARATLAGYHFGTGPVSRMWAGWRQAFEALLDDANPRIVRIGERGVETTRERERRELELERYEDVHGLG